MFSVFDWPNIRGLGGARAFCPPGYVSVAEINMAFFTGSAISFFAFYRYGDPDPALIRFERPCQHNGKSFQCATVKKRHVQTLRQKFYADPIKANQDIRLCHMLSVAPIARRRSAGVNVVPLKNLSVSYFIKCDNKATRVCQKFFVAALSVSKQRVNTVAKVIRAGEVPKENRGGDRKSQKSEGKKECVRNFLKRLKGRESHYNRKKSKRIYLSASLSVAKLWRLFNKECPQNRVSYFMFRKIFIHDFNIGFSSPASDVCSTCTRLKQQYKFETKAEIRNELLVEYRVHRKRAAAFYELAKEVPENSLSFCFDLEQVQPLPRTAIGDAFYSHQLSFYAFCCVELSSRNPIFYVWTEDYAGRGSTEIASALLHHLDSLDYDGIEQVRLFCDGCTGQNKNSYIVHALMFWLKNKSPKGLSEISITFPVRGHSFMAADRCFGRVEKLLRKNTDIISKEEYIKFYLEVGKVKLLGKDWKIYSVKELEKVYNKVKGIAETKRIFIRKKSINQRSPKIEVYTHLYYRFAPENKSCEMMLKKGKNDENLSLNIIESRNSLPDKKKPSLRKLLKELFGENWTSRADLKWYKDLLISDNPDPEPTDKERDEGEQNVPCDCLDEETALHI